MATYHVINRETGERQSIERSVHDIMDWYDENPGWERDWSHGAAAIGEVGDWKTKNIQKNPGWKDVLNKVREVPGNTLDKNHLY